MDAADAAAAALSNWAQAFVALHPSPWTPERLRELQQLERQNPVPLRRAIATLEPMLFAVALVHYGCKGIVREKVRLVRTFTGEHMAHRSYWDKLGMAHHFVAGVVFERREFHAVA